ncbi:MAG: TetR/AcrR family transcriptional regulator [Phycisphaerae bacterium]|nr:TetR/AcrR family transcriptional regulator [Phycisphaerae bacterium]
MTVRMKAAERRLQLLETAAQLFAEHGYRGTTTAMLAKRARISEPILYRHFANKRDLFIALIESAGYQVLATWEEAIRTVASPVEQLRVILHRNPATGAAATRDVYRVLFQASTEFTEPQIQDAIREHYERYLRFLSGIVTRAQAAGQVRTDLDSETLAWQIIHAGIGFAMVRPLGIGDHGSDAFIHETIRLILAMLAPPVVDPPAL